MTWRGLDDFVTRARSRLDPLEGPGRLPDGGDQDFLAASERETVRAAAVLIGIIPRETGPTALLTRRPDTMATHAGQVAFPGGKIDAGDADAVAAALREAHEEVGVDPAQVDLIGLGAPYVTGTGFRITPVIGLLPAGFEARACSFEVADVFETPLGFLMDPANHTEGRAVYKGKARRYYEMPHNGFRIWGVTAGIIRTLYLDLYAHSPHRSA